MATNPPGDLTLSPLNGGPRTVREWLTNFHLVLVVVDPYEHESAWILPTAGRIMRVFGGADCRVSWLVAGDAADARRFLGPWAAEFLTFADPERAAIKAMGLAHLPALVHLDQDAAVVGAAEGWQPLDWRRITDRLADRMSWGRPTVPERTDPAPFEGSPALV